MPSDTPSTRLEAVISTELYALLEKAAGVLVSQLEAVDLDESVEAHHLPRAERQIFLPLAGVDIGDGRSAFLLRAVVAGIAHPRRFARCSEILKPVMELAVDRGVSGKVGAHGLAPF